MSTTSARNPGIDLLRVLSIVLVLLNHIGLRIRLTQGVFAGSLPRQFLTDLTFNGSEAVFIFFVISGFLIATNSIERWGSLGAIDSRAFYVRRAARIVPCLVGKEKASLPGMAGIAMGVLAAIIAAHHQPKGRWAIRALQAFGACGVFAVLGFEGNLLRWIGHGAILLLTFSAACLVLGFQWQARTRPGWSLRGTGWLQSFGRLSYEIYLTHMFVILSVVRIFRTSGTGIRWGVLWYPPALALAWTLGWLVAKCFSAPCERFLRQRLMKPKPVAAVKTVASEA